MGGYWLRHGSFHSISNPGIDIVLGVLGMMILFPMFVVLSAPGLDVVLIMMSAVIIYWVVILSMYNAVSGVLVVALYRYAVRVELSRRMPQDFVRDPWSY